MSTNANNNFLNLRLPTGFAQRISLAWASNSTLSIGAGNFRDSTDSQNIFCPAVTLNAATTGANGLDTGSLANSTWYYLHAITNSLNIGTLSAPNGAYLLSTSFSAPILPTGYDTFRCVGVWVTDGSAHFLKMYKAGNTYQYDAKVSVLSAGNATSATAINLSSAVPSNNLGNIRFYSAFTPATAGHTVQYQPVGATGFVHQQTGEVATVVADQQFDMIPLFSSGIPELNYQVSNSSDAVSLSVQAFEFLP